MMMMMKKKKERKNKQSSKTIQMNPPAKRCESHVEGESK